MRREGREELLRLIEVEEAFGIDFVICSGRPAPARQVPSGESQGSAPVATAPRSGTSADGTGRPVAHNAVSAAPPAHVPVQSDNGSARCLAEKPTAPPPREEAAVVVVPVATRQESDLFATPASESLIPKTGSKAEKLKHIELLVKKCEQCSLCRGRTQAVFGVGNPDADLMFVGEAPGREEDLQGEPFVGRAGQLLNKIIEEERSLGMKRADVRITNVVRCRPPENRQPSPEEVTVCRPYLLAEIEVVKPKIICALGTTAVRGLTGSTDPLSRIRGTFFLWKGFLVIPTFHPAYLLRNPEEKRKAWEDVKKIREKLASLRSGGG